MPLKDLISTPGEVAASSITKRFRYSGSAHEDLHAAIVKAVDAAVAEERERCAKLADELGNIAPHVRACLADTIVAAIRGEELDES